MGVPVGAAQHLPVQHPGPADLVRGARHRGGHLGARGGVDLMVAMNPQTWDKDVASIEPGGYLFYDSTKPMPPSKFREDITVIGVPLTAICNATYTDPRQRQLFKNIIYVGALSRAARHRPEGDRAADRRAVQGQGKADRSPNVRRCIWAATMRCSISKCPIGLRMRRADKVGDRIFIEGNSAAALGAVYGGATVCAWYPITPSTSLAEAFTAIARSCASTRKPARRKYAIVQAEDELASIGMVIGAGWNGARAFTATSGPGISLMQEFIGLPISPKFRR
jgi:2-oxoglutarate ferredoxin oxidoreductase subunit alpha